MKNLYHSKRMTWRGTTRENPKTPGIKKGVAGRLSAILTIALASITVNCCFGSDWTLIDDFQGYPQAELAKGSNDWAIAMEAMTRINVVDDSQRAGNKAARIVHQETGTVSDRNYTHDVFYHNGALRLEPGKIATIFMRFLIEESQSATQIAGSGTRPGERVQMGINLTEGPLFSSTSRAGVSLEGEREIGVVGSGRTRTALQAGSLPKLQRNRWYRLWMVVHNAPGGETNKSKAYVQEEGGDGKLIPVPGLIVPEKDYRPAVWKTVGFIKAAIAPIPNVLVDDFYVDNGGENLGDPLAAGKVLGWREQSQQEARVALASMKPGEANGFPLLNGPVRVGPFYPQTVNGIAWVVADRMAYHLAVGIVEKDQLRLEYTHLAKVWRRLAAASDSSYYAMEWSLAAATVRLRWAAQQNGAVTGVVESDRPVRIALVARPSWRRDFAAPMYRGTTADGLVAPATGSSSYWSVRALSPVLRQAAAMDSDTMISGLLSTGTESSSSVEGTWAGQVFEVTPSAPLRFVAAAGSESAGTEVADVDARLSQAEHRYKDEIPKDPDLEAIKIEMNYSRLYSPVLKTLAHTISRGWCGADEIRLFGWDSFFNGLLAIRSDPGTARDTIRGILAAATPEGYVPNIGSDRSRGAPSNRSEPPVGAMSVWKMHECAPDIGFLAEVYPKLVKWHEWWFAINPSTGKPNRDGNQNGLLEWGCDNGQVQDVKFESGIDDSPSFDEMEVDPVTKTMRLDVVDLSALWAMDAEFLGKMAEALGKPVEARRFQQEVQAMNKKMNELLWDDQAGLYANRYWEPRRESFRITPETIPAACWRTPTGEPGVRAEYFKGMKIGTPAASGTMPCIEIPAKELEALAMNYGGDDQKRRFSVRWTGSLVPDHTGLYALSLETICNSQVWIDGKLILDQSRAVMYPHLRTQPVTLEAGRPYEIKAEYSGRGAVRMVWFRLPEPAPAPRVFSGRFPNTCFYPMISGAPDAAQAKRMLDIFRDEGRFWGECVIPTVSRDDPAFPKQHYWRGKVWGPTNYLVWLGLQRYGEPSLLASVAGKSEALFMRNWQEGTRCHENYLCDGSGSNDPFYTWGALLALMQVEYRKRP